MSNSDSFISEVSEEVRRDRFFRFLRRYGWLLALALVLIVGAAAANEWLQARRAEQARIAGGVLREAILLDDPSARAERLGEVAPVLGDAAVVARLAQAGSLLDAGDPAAAAAILATIAEDGGTSAIYRDLAALQRIAILGEALPEGERMATLEALTAASAPFRPLALEQRALAFLKAGERDRALADLDAALAEPGAPEGLRARARQLIIAAGGALPAENPVSPLTVDG